MNKKWLIGLALILTTTGSGLLYLVNYELAMCRLADEDGVMVGMVVAIPRYNYCLYMMKLGEQQSQNQPGDLFPAGYAGLTTGKHPGDQSTNRNLIGTRACIQQYFQTTLSIHSSQASEVDHSI